MWDASQYYLAEKSPQSMLKIPYLDSVYSAAQERKYIVVIKVNESIRIDIYSITLIMITDK